MHMVTRHFHTYKVAQAQSPILLCADVLVLNNALDRGLYIDRISLSPVPCLRCPLYAICFEGHHCIVCREHICKPGFCGNVKLLGESIHQPHSRATPAKQDCPLQGGMPGAERLGKCQELMSLLEKQRESGRIWSAICASPAVVFEPQGWLKGKKATCHPAFVERLADDRCAAICCDISSVVAKFTGHAGCS